VRGKPLEDFVALGRFGHRAIGQLGDLPLDFTACFLLDTQRGLEQSDIDIGSALVDLLIQPPDYLFGGR
jgi:hypothetical protein